MGSLKPPDPLIQWNTLIALSKLLTCIYDNGNCGIELNVWDTSKRMPVMEQKSYIWQIF